MNKLPRCTTQTAIPEHKVYFLAKLTFLKFLDSKKFMVIKIIYKCNLVILPGKSRLNAFSNCHIINALTLRIKQAF
jgi:hypothetical protein